MTQFFLKTFRIIGLLAVVCLGLVTIIGTGGGSSSSNGSSGDLSGTWALWNQSANENTESFSQEVILRQDGNNISMYSSCGNHQADMKIEGKSITLQRIIADEMPQTISGTIHKNNTTINGTFTDREGTGTFRLEKVSDFDSFTSLCDNEV